jgi:cell division protein FtsQ
MSTIAYQDRTLKKYEHRSPPRVTRLLTVIIAALGAVLAAEVVFHLVVSPRLTVTRVEITAGAGLPLTDQAILRLAGLPESMNYYAIHTQDVARRLGTHPSVREATVKKRFPDTIMIHVESRIPVALSLVEIEGATVPVALDDEGVVFQIGESVSELDLPVLSGLRFEDVALGQQLDGALVGLLKDLRLLRSAHPALYALVSELRLVKKRRTDPEALLYLRSHPIRARIGAELRPETLREILLVLDVLLGRGVVQDLEEVDFRAMESVVARYRTE